MERRTGVKIEEVRIMWRRNQRWQILHDISVQGNREQTCIDSLCKRLQWRAIPRNNHENLSHLNQRLQIIWAHPPQVPRKRKTQEVVVPKNFFYHNNIYTKTLAFQGNNPSRLVSCLATTLNGVLAAARFLNCCLAQSSELHKKAWTRSFFFS